MSPIHWHIDYLTVAADVTEAVVLEKGHERAIVYAQTGSSAFRPAVKGFGSRDWRLRGAFPAIPWHRRSQVQRNRCGLTLRGITDRIG